MRWLFRGTFLILMSASLLACDKAAVNIEALDSKPNDDGGGGGGGGVSPNTPVITPVTASGLKLKAGNLQTFNATVTDADGDLLTYSWKLNGANSPKLVGANNTATLTSDSALIGEANITLNVSDGVRSASYTWTTQVNNFEQSCNDMDNLSQSNKTCVYSGISSVGDGLTPVTEASSIFMRPTDVVTTASGDLFVADEANHVIWFWNRSAADQTMLGILVPSGKIRVVAGVGIVGAPGSASPVGTTPATRNALNSPGGIAYDGTHLYISNTGSNSVVRVDPAGVLGNVATTGCSGPRGLARLGSNLYVACLSSNVVRSIDVSTLVAMTIAGTGSAAHSTSTNASLPTVGVDANLYGPFGLAFDSIGNLFISEYTGCRIRALNLSGAGVSYFGTWSIPAGNIRTVLGAGGPSSCGSILGEAANLSGASDARINQPKHLSFSPEGHLLISSTAGHQIVALNFGAASASFLGQTIPSYQVVNVAGIMPVTGGYNGENGLATSSRFSYPTRMIYDSLSGDYLVADYSNLRLRKVSGTDYRTSLIAGNGSQRSAMASTQSATTVTEEKMNSPKHMIYDAINEITFVADNMNDRIRVINIYGVVTQAVGTGISGAGTEEGELPTSSTMNSPGGLALTHGTASFGGHLVWTDGANHRVRIWNRSSSAATLFGVFVDAGRVATIGGGAISGNLTSGPALANAFNQPSGVAWNPTTGALYISDMNNHCVKVIDSAGQLSVAAGSCGISGSVDGPPAPGAGRLNSPEGLAFYRSGATEGLFIADRANSRVRFLRTAGAGSIAGIPAAVGSAVTVAGGGTFYDNGIAATAATLSLVQGVTTTDTKFCFTGYSLHNVRCVGISDGVIQTVMGPQLGVTTTPGWFGGTSLSATGQNGVSAYAADGSGGLLLYPFGITTLDNGTILVNEFTSNLIRKIKF